MAGGDKTNFNQDPPPVARTIDAKRISQEFNRNLPTQFAYTFSNHRQFEYPPIPGQYDPSTDIIP